MLEPSIEYLGELYWEGRYRMAVEVGEALITAGTDDEEEVFLKTCDAYFSMGKIRAAESLLGDRADDWAEYIRARACFLRGHTNEVNAFISRPIGVYEPKVREMRDLLVAFDEASMGFGKTAAKGWEAQAKLPNIANSDDLESIRGAISFHGQGGDTAKAMPLAIQLSECSECYGDQIQLVRLLVMERRANQTAEAWKRVLVTSPRSFAAHFALGVRLQRLRRFRESEFYFTQILILRLAPSEACIKWTETGAYFARMAQKIPFWGK